MVIVSLNAQNNQTGGQSRGSSLGKVSPKDKRWKKFKGFNWKMFDLFQSAKKLKIKYAPERYSLDQYKIRLAECSYNLQLLMGKNSSGERDSRLQSARFCRISVCPVCQWRRQLLWRSKINKALADIKLKYPKMQFIFLTLTIKNCPISQLGNTLDSMALAWHRMMDCQEFKATPIKGFLRGVEITKGFGRLAHPHYHCLFAVTTDYFAGKSYISQRKLSFLWQRSLRLDYTPVVDIRAVKEVKDNNIDKAVMEIAKYMVKPADLVLDYNWTFQLIDQIYKKRRFATGGIFKKCIKENEENREDLLATTDRFYENLTNSALVSFEWDRGSLDYFETERLEAVETDLEILAEANQNYQDYLEQEQLE